MLEEVNKRLLELKRFCLENDFETSFAEVFNNTLDKKTNEINKAPK